MADLEKSLDAHPVALTLPIGAELTFNGVIDVLAMKALIYADASGKPREEALSAEQKDARGNGAHAPVRGRRRDRRRAAREVPRQGRAGGRRVARGAARGHRRRQADAGAVRLGHSRISASVRCSTRSTRCSRRPTSGRRAQGFSGANSEPVERAPDPAAPFSAFVFKTVIDPFAGKLSIFRVVSGRAVSDATVLNSTRGVRERFGQLLRLEGKKQSPIASRAAGRDRRGRQAQRHHHRRHAVRRKIAGHLSAPPSGRRRSSPSRFVPRPRATSRKPRRRCSTWSRRTAHWKPIATRKPTRSSCRAPGRCISRSRSRSSNVNLM